MTTIEPSNNPANTAASVRERFILAFASRPKSRTLDDIAEETGINPATVRSYATGRRKVRGEHWAPLAAALGIDLLYFHRGGDLAAAKARTTLEQAVAEQARELAALRDAVAALETRLVPLEKADQADAQARRQGREMGA